MSAEMNDLDTFIDNLLKQTLGKVSPPPDPDAKVLERMDSINKKTIRDLPTLKKASLTHPIIFLHTQSKDRKKSDKLEDLRCPRFTLTYIPADGTDKSGEPIVPEVVQDFLEILPEDIDSLSDEELINLQRQYSWELEMMDRTFTPDRFGIRHYDLSLKKRRHRFFKQPKAPKPCRNYTFDTKLELQAEVDYLIQKLAKNPSQIEKPLLACWDVEFETRLFASDYHCLADLFSGWVDLSTIVAGSLSHLDLDSRKGAPTAKSVLEAMGYDDEHMLYWHRNGHWGETQFSESTEPMKVAVMWWELIHLDLS